MNKKLFRIVCSAILLAAACVMRASNAAVAFTLFLGSYVVVGYDILRYAALDLIRGSFIGENFLMSIATIGAFAIGEYFEGVLVMLLYQIGEMFQGYAVNRSRDTIASLLDIRPDSATVYRNEQWCTVDPEEVTVGETIQVKPGERIPLDAVILSGQSYVDTAALTGEAIPRDVNPGDLLLSGCINGSGLLTATVSKCSEESTASKILDLVENAAGNKSRSERFITRFARVYTPIVVLLAILLATIPPLLTGQLFAEWLRRALSFLVVSCPCALVISVPLSFFGGIGGASKRGILVKGGNDLEALAHAEMVVFDKTGTLTKGIFALQTIHAESMEDAELLDLVAHAQSASSHPIALSIRQSYEAPIDDRRVAAMEDIRGHGVRAIVDGRQIVAGNARLMAKEGVSHTQDACIGTIVHVAIDGQYAGHLCIADEIKPEANEAMQALRGAGITNLYMLTGDVKHVGESTAKQLGLDQAFTELLPFDKVAEIETLLKQKTKKGTLVYVGDGMNDAPVLARADVGIAMGTMGSDAAIEAADIVIMDDSLSKLPIGIRIAKRTLSISNQNIYFSIGVKVVVLLLSALGLTTMLVAVLADVGVTVLAILNAMRALRS